MDRSPSSRPDRRDRRHRYRFRSTWDLDAPPERVYAVLERAEQYPDWWPQVRSSGPPGAPGHAARIRAVLPYELRITVVELLRDPARGVLQAALHGDIEGWARWTVRARQGSGGMRTRALYEQEVEVRRPLLRMLSPAGRPLLRLNHALMMRAGRRALAARLAAPPEAV
ncbi:SRPBCC family protein [Streptomyces sp. NPDC046866]|uniref:SRPBCC family protein n=1 Tax=Streptomyces sp. NPDC046866 TaxID=3154921 RepID=UPI003451A63A